MEMKTCPCVGQRMEWAKMRDADEPKGLAASEIRDEDAKYWRSESANGQFSLDILRLRGSSRNMFGTR
jgi:hypothetical protein